jgi:hypothetical protein
VSQTQRVTRELIERVFQIAEFLFEYARTSQRAAYRSPTPTQPRSAAEPRHLGCYNHIDTRRLLSYCTMTVDSDDLPDQF